MAGEWLKVEHATPNKAEVHVIADILKMDPEKVFAKCFRVWAWASDNCPVSGRTNVRAMSAISLVAGETRFGNAMVEAGWLAIEGDEIVFPHFDYHCSQSAKQRALDARRKKEKRAAKPSGKYPDPNRTKTGPEKRRYNLLTSFPELDCDEFRSAWSDYEQYRKESRVKPLQPRSVESKFAELSEWGKETAIAAIRETIKQGYQGIFHPKPNGSKPDANPAKRPSMTL